jgi:hypothetical protein
MWVEGLPSRYLRLVNIDCIQVIFEQHSVIEQALQYLFDDLFTYRFTAMF